LVPILEVFFWTFWLFNMTLVFERGKKIEYRLPDICHKIISFLFTEFWVFYLSTRKHALLRRTFLYLFMTVFIDCWPQIGIFRYQGIRRLIVFFSCRFTLYWKCNCFSLTRNHQNSIFLNLADTKKNSLYTWSYFIELVRGQTSLIQLMLTLFILITDCFAWKWVTLSLAQRKLLRLK
jgi:hypothetical protein